MLPPQRCNELFVWRRGEPEPRIRIRSRREGRWTAWRPAPVLHDLPDAEDEEWTGRAGTQPVWVGAADGIQVPEYDRHAVRPAVVHFGVGGFHRAHQAVYFDELAQQGISRDWGIVGVSMHRREMKDINFRDAVIIVVELARPHQKSPRPSASPTMACAYQTGKMVATTMAETEEFAKS